MLSTVHLAVSEHLPDGVLRHNAQTTSGKRLLPRDLLATIWSHTFSQTKGNRPRTIPLTAQARSAIEGNQPPLPHHRVWPYPYERFRRMFERVNCPSFS